MGGPGSGRRKGGGSKRKLKKPAIHPLMRKVKDGEKGAFGRFGSQQWKDSINKASKKK